MGWVGQKCSPKHLLIGTVQITSRRDLTSRAMGTKELMQKCPPNSLMGTARMTPHLHPSELREIQISCKSVHITLMPGNSQYSAIHSSWEKRMKNRTGRIAGAMITTDTTPKPNRTQLPQISSLFVSLPKCMKTFVQGLVHGQPMNLVDSYCQSFTTIQGTLALIRKVLWNNRDLIWKLTQCN